MDQHRLKEWFEAANQALANTPTSSSSASSSSASSASSATPPVGLLVAAELQFTETGPTITTSDSFTFVIFQSLVDPSPTF
jgi:hypothetical protein